MKKVLLIVLATLTICGVGVYAAIVFGVGYLARKASVPALPIATPLLATQTVSDVTYCSSGGASQLLDLYIPSKGAATFPLVVYIHGGSWVSGSKDEEALSQYLPALAQAGYVVASLNYRLAPQYTFPAQVDDVKCAIRFLRAHAGQYHINAGHVAAVGESAGGYLAAFTGATGNLGQFKTTAYTNGSDAVQAVVDISGPADFTNAAGASNAAMQTAYTFLGSAQPATASVTTYITPHAAPFLILHGADDTVVPAAQSEELQSKLQAAGDAAKLILVQQAGHSLDATTIQPDFSQLAVDILTFLQQTLH